MRLPDGRYECSYCGAVLDIPSTVVPTVMFRAASGKPNTRTLTFDGDIHICEIGVAPDRGLRQAVAQ